MKLWIIGNGFDLAHGLPTSYEHFHKWLKERKRCQFVDMFESMYPKVKNTDGLWSDIESALGQTTVEEIVRYAKTYRYCPEDEVNSVGNINVVTTGIQCYLDLWAKQIDLSPTKPTYKIDNDAKYLTFNYTMTLEQVYSIPAENILHIHHSVESDSNLIIGYESSTESQRHVYAKENGADAELNREAKVDNDRYIKNPTYQISQNDRFFQSLSDINEVCVFGHSLSKVDMPYIKKVSECVCENSLWHLYLKDYSPESIKCLTNLNGIVEEGQIHKHLSNELKLNEQ